VTHTSEENVALTTVQGTDGWPGVEGTRLTVSVPCEP
jgi:hypothetical protein